MGIATDLAMGLDPVILAREARVEPDPWQAQVLRSSSQRLILNCSRQAGKSTVAAILTAHTVLYEPGAMVLLLSPGLRQSSELFRKCLGVYHALGKPVDPESETALTLQLENGARIVSLPGTETTVRGYSAVRLLIVDEASRVQDSLYQSIRPMLAVSGGRLLLMSTPFGKRGFFFDEWTSGRPGWERVEIHATECPRISPAFLANEKATMPDVWFRQEYDCEFVDTVDQAFRFDDVMGALDPSVKPLFGAL
jgi:Terminase large subunit, T4likevirus-type, N-terminal